MRLLMTYREPRWGTELAGEAAVRQDMQDCYWVNSVAVLRVHTQGNWTGLILANDTQVYLRTAAFQRVSQEQHEQG